MTLKITSDNISPATLSALGGSGVEITSLAYAGVTTAADSNGGETLTITGSGFNANARVYIDNTSCSTTYVNSTSLTFIAPAKSVGSYLLYVYNTNGTFALKLDGITYTSYITSAVEYLVVAGGGSGGGGGQTFAQGGGGGAGGYRTDTGFAVTAGTPITITVGAGGSTGSAYYAGNQGSNSVFGTITSRGGGRGGAYETGQAASAGGSGGGGGTGGPSGTSSAGAAGNTPTTSPSQGNTGGNANNPGTFNTIGAGGGGGGASAVGAVGNGGVGGIGGAGSSSSISGSSVTYAGGGGGGASSTGGSGGSSIGGAGGSGGGAGGAVGTINTGSGGGGGGAIGSGGGSTGGAGGSGVVIIRYADTYAVAVSTTGSPTITVAGGYRVYQFTSSGSITF
jgi:hypothetical protein